MRSRDFRRPTWMKHAISIDDLCVSFRDEPVLQDISLAFSNGSFTSIVGPSGCGKSTLLRSVASLVQPTTGSVALNLGQKNGGTAFVFQSPNLLPWRNVVQNIQLPLELRGESTTTQEQRASDCLDLVGLLDRDRAKLPRMLSGGMQMRVSLARALVTNPEVLLLDEPFAALDDILRQQLNEELLRLWTAKHWTTLFVTHNVSEAVYLAQRVVIMSSRPGRIANVVEVPFEYPRPASLRASGEFASFAGRVSEELREVTV